MKRILSSIAMITLAVASWAVPAKPGLWKTIKLDNGTEVRAQLVGDEFGSYWLAESGVGYVQNIDKETFRIADIQKIEARAKELRNKFNSEKAAMNVGKAPGNKAVFTGERKALFILVEFPDLKFKEGHDQAYYNDVCNKENFSSTDGFVGSVRDYFRDQSYGEFTLDFDVVGPVQMPNSYTYYGANDTYGNDSRPGTMVATACQLIAQQGLITDFSVYDWDGNKEADQVFVLYAGEGEATGGGTNTIWPHESRLLWSDYGKRLNANGTYINTYACSNEMNEGSIVAGIGTICHEFSHCLGFPDMYDTANHSNYGMGSWDLMCQGSYNGNTFCPSGYTGYEKMVAGWKNPIEITGTMSVNNMKALSDGGEFYAIYNNANRNEYYILENRQFIGWDIENYGKGLLVYHVDYDRNAWSFNTVNNTADHQRCAIVAADNSYNQYYATDIAGDAFPSSGNNKLTSTTTPSTSLFNANSDGTNFLDKSILNIRDNGDGTVSFNVVDNNDIGANKPEGALFYESFDLNYGVGGNDGNWDGTVTTEELITDNDGWSATGGAGAFKCAKLGTTKSAGRATTPFIEINGETQLTFKAAPFNNEVKSLTVSTSGAVTTISDKTFTLEAGKWTDCSTLISGEGSIKIIIKANGYRFLLDEVVVIPSALSGIDVVNSNATQNANKGIYTIDGRYVGMDFNKLQKGIYIVNGKKIVK